MTILLRVPCGLRISITAQTTPQNTARHQLQDSQIVTTSYTLDEAVSQFGAKVVQDLIDRWCNTLHSLAKVSRAEYKRSGKVTQIWATFFPDTNSFRSHWIKRRNGLDQYVEPIGNIAYRDYRVAVTQRTLPGIPLSSL